MSGPERGDDATEQESDLYREGVSSEEATGDTEEGAENEREPAEEGGDPEEEGAEPGGGVLASVPEWVVPLGAGGLLAAALITAGMAAFVAYLLVTGQTLDFPRYQLMLGLFQFSVLTLFQAVGIYLARKRMRWTVTMVAAIMGATALLTIPFSVLAVVCLGLGRHHFRLATPADSFDR